jgi:hypothetical protein
VLGALAVGEAWFRGEREQRTRRVLAAALPFVVLLAAVAPWIVYYELATRVRAANSPWHVRFLELIWKLNLFVVPVLVLALAIPLARRRWASLDPAGRRWLASGIALPPLLVLWVSAVAPMGFHRYIVAVTPLACLVSAWLAVEGARFCVARVESAARGIAATVLALGAVVVLGVSSFVSLPVSAAYPGFASAMQWREIAFRGELTLLVRELFFDRPDPNRMIVQALAPRLRPGDEILVNYEDIPLMFYTDATVRGGVAAFRAEDDRSSPPRFAVIRHSVPFVHWDVFKREYARYSWNPIAKGIVDVPYGNNPDPDMYYDVWIRQGDVLVAERAAR